MRIYRLRIVNFRCFAEEIIYCGAMHALVGANCAGKSTVVHALDFLFNASAPRITKDWFHHRNTKEELRVEAIFTHLTDAEKEAFKGYLRPDDSFELARIVKWVGDGDDASAEVSQAYNKPLPKIDWLNPNKIDAESIKRWSEGPLIAHGQSFAEFMRGEKLAVVVWKQRAAQFADKFLSKEDYEDAWVDNPKGFGGVLKGNLPHYELIPAVRAVEDESKVGKTNPFGRLIHSVIEELDPELKKQIEEILNSTTKRLNRSGGKERIKAITDMEERLQEYVREIIPADIELEFEAPTVETMLTTPTIMVDDGFRGPVQLTGHGLQRAIIMSILGAYAEFSTVRDKGERRTLILGVEEPELYMHPPMLRSVRKLLRKIADSGDQVFFTTHNPGLVDVGFFDEIIRVENDEKFKRAAIRQLFMSNMIEDLELRRPNLKGKVSPDSIRERYSHVYTTTRSEGFFARKVFLVEGLTELYCLPIYAAGLGIDFDSLGIVVVECGTKDQIDRLYRVFNELGIPCYILFDYDLGGESEANSEMLLKTLGLEIGKPVTTVIGDMVAYFKTDWEHELTGEIRNYEQLAGEATRSLGLRSDTGKPLRARYIATTLSKMQQPQVPPTIEKIIRRGLEVKHTGSCLLHEPVAVAAERI